MYTEQQTKPLTYTKTRLLEVLKQRLAEREDKRKKAKEKLAAKNKKVHDRIAKAMENPQFVIWLTSIIRDDGFDPSSETFEAAVSETWPDTNGDDLPEHLDEDADLKKLIRAYENADDEKFEIQVTDDAYRHL